MFSPRILATGGPGTEDPCLCPSAASSARGTAPEDPGPRSGRVEAALAVYPSKLFPRGTLPQGGIEEERPSWSTLFLLLSPPGEDTKKPCPCILRGTIPKTSCILGRAGRNLASPGEWRIRTLLPPNTCGPGTPEDPGPRSGGVKAALAYPNLVPPRNPASKGNRGRAAFLVCALPLLFFHTHYQTPVV